MARLFQNGHLSIKDKLKCKLLIRCVQEDDYSMCKKLLESWDGEINYCPEDGAGAIHLAAGISDNILLLLLENDADPNLRSSEGSVALHVAATYGRVKAIALLLSYGADSNIIDEERTTPLDRARANGCRLSTTLLEQAVMGLNPEKIVLKKQFVDITSTDDPGDTFKNIYEETFITSSTLSKRADTMDTSSTATDSFHTCSDPPSPDLFTNLGNTNSSNLQRNRGLLCKEVKDPWLEENTTKNSIQHSVGSHDSFPTVLEMDTPSSLNNLSRLTDFVPDSLLDQLEKLNLSLDKSTGVGTQISKTPVTQDQGLHKDAELISDDETILCEERMQRYSELMSPPHQKTKCYDLDSNYRYHPFPKAWFLSQNQRYVPTEIADMTYASDGPMTSSVIGNKQAALPNISLTSISSQGSEDIGSQIPPTVSCCNPTFIEVHKDESGNDFVVELTLPKDGCESCTDVGSVCSDSESEGTVLYDWKTTSDCQCVQVPDEIRKMTNAELGAALIAAGLSQPGPITMTTRNIYEIRLVRLRQDPSLADKSMGVKYSPELEDLLNYKINASNLSDLETSMVQPFSEPDPRRPWREGIKKSSFNYLLLDPRITSNLPRQVKILGENAAFKIFLSAIFYVGKGKKSRAFAHFKEAMKGNTQSEKVKQIRAIWKEGLGVVALHVFQNTIPTEAYTREACIIMALGLDRLTNIQAGQCYGPAAAWSSHKKRCLGVLLLRKAFKILLIDGERQIKPIDLK